MGQGRPMMAKLLLEGKEVPFIGATITSAVNQASIAYIDVVPQEEINHIAPRTHVSIQVRNFHDTETNGGFPYVTAWEGEVFGYSFGKTPTSRSFSLHCIDQSSYWDNVLTYFFDPQHTLGQGGDSVVDAGLQTSVAQQSGTKVITVARSTASFFASVINDTLKDSTKDFLDGIIAIYGEIGNINDFYREADTRLRITDRILLHSSGKLQELVDYAQAQPWILGMIGKTSGYTSLRGVIQDLMSIIFHDFVSVPFPAKVEKEGLSKPLPSLDDKARTVGTFIFKPNLFTIPPPLCNVFFPDEYSSFQFQRNFFKEPTRLLYFPKMPVVLAQRNLSLPMIAQPPSLQHYVYGKGEYGKDSDGNELSGDGATQISGQSPGHANDPTEGATKEITDKKRLGQFLTNEEKLKGIWTAMESMMPATTQFASSLTEAFQADFLKKISKYLFYKKRFENRSLQITSHLKMSVVPGFNVLLLDDSSADQNVLAYCSSVTHRIYATEGGYTNVILSYARTYHEEDQASKGGGEPLVPPWFLSSIFGAAQSNPPSKVDSAGVENKTLHVSPPDLSAFYRSLLGSKGSKAITNYDPNEPTVRGAVKRLISDYREAKSRGVGSVQDLIRRTTERDYVLIRDAYRFIGAEPDGQTRAENDVRGSFIEFSGGPFINWSKMSEIPADKRPQYLRQIVVEKYRNALKNFRGFRG